MNSSIDPGSKGRKRVYYAFLAAPFIYMTLIFFMEYQLEWKPLFPFTEEFYLSLAYAVFLLMFPRSFKENLWKKRKVSISSPRDFYSAFFSVSIVTLAFPESIGVIGVLVYEMTGDLLLPIGLNLISFFGVALYLPKQAEIEEKIKEFHFKDA